MNNKIDYFNQFALKAHELHVHLSHKLKPTYCRSAIEIMCTNKHWQAISLVVKESRIDPKLVVQMFVISFLRSVQYLMFFLAAYFFPSDVQQETYH